MKLTQKAIKEHVRAMIDSGTLDNDYMNDLFMYHPRRVKKMQGREISDWRVCDLNRGIEVVFTDGTCDTVSWHKMAKAKSQGKQKAADASRRQDVIAAFRREVQYQADQFRAREGVGDTVNFHTGHDYVNGDRFVEILKHFLQEKKIQPSTLKVTKINRQHYRLTDQSIAEEWKAYHSKHAMFRMETAEENLKGNTGFKVEKWFS